MSTQPEIVQRVMRFAGKTRGDVRNPNISARECIELANWIAANVEGVSAYIAQDAGMSNEQQILQKLQAYSDEIYGERGRLSGKLTIDELIDSHRHLREQYGRYLDEYNTIMLQARADGVKLGKEYITDQHLNKDQLKAMTIQELVELLAD